MPRLADTVAERLFKFHLWPGVRRNSLCKLNIHEYNDLDWIMRIFIYCPAGYVSGGPEALHQLAHKAGEMGLDASIVYYPEGQAHPIPEPYVTYNVKVASRAIDAVDTVVVVPEVATGMLWRFRKASRVIWWLSIDNYYNRRKKRGLKKRLMDRLKGVWDFDFRRYPRLYHAAQSVYAQEFLQRKGVSDVFMLTDYLRKEYIDHALHALGNHRSNVIAYNPLKGFEFTRRLIETATCDARWTPIKGMTPSEVRELLSGARAYIDFGTHPGRDRLPREAAISGCCVVTGRQGSAGNPMDVPVPEKYKFDEKDASVFSKVDDMLADILDNYQDHVGEFEGYRKQIVDQEKVFEDEISAIFPGVKDDGQ